jgi:SAM-dependent methyltransferase
MSRERIRSLAHVSLAKGDALGWFHDVYEGAEGDLGAVPWADCEPNPWLVKWLRETPLAQGVRALVVGCGLGDDAELLAARGASVTAFDYAPTAVAWCKARWPATRVDYRTADLLASSVEWRHAYDLVFEAYTVQCFAYGSDERARAMDALRTFLAPGGRLLLVARAADSPPGIDGGPPWPLVRAEIERIGTGLTLAGFEDVDDQGTRRFVVSFACP